MKQQQLERRERVLVGIATPFGVAFSLLFMATTDPDTTRLALSGLLTVSCVTYLGLNHIRWTARELSQKNHPTNRKENK